MAADSDFDPVPSWLRESRLSERRADGKPWTQEDLIAAMKAEIGWAPHRPNYSRYEVGRSKPKDTLPRFVEFWAARGKPGPDYTPPKAPAPPVDPVAAAIEAQTKMLERVLTEFSQALRRLRAIPNPDELETLLRYAREQGWLSPADDPDRQPVGQS